MNWKLLTPFGVALLGGTFFSLASIYLAVGLGILLVSFVAVSWLSWRIAKGVEPRSMKEVYALLPLALFFAIIITDLPFQWAFSINRDKFDQVAARVESGDVPEAPFWIGPFRIAMAGKKDYSGAVYLAVNSDKWEIEGFVPDPEGKGFNLWSSSQLDDSWSFVVED